MCSVGELAGTFGFGLCEGRMGRKIQVFEKLLIFLLLLALLLLVLQALHLLLL